MATVIVSNTYKLSDVTGHGNQSHLVYAVNQQRWWCFVCDSKVDTSHVRCYVSSSNDLTSATWSAGTTSPAFSHVLAHDLFFEQRNLGVVGITNGSTDAVHCSVSVLFDTTNSYQEHIRATFTGASSITWDASWNETTIANNSTLATAICGNALGVSTTGFIHETSLALSADFSNGYPTSRISTNADTGSSWTNGFGATAKPDSQANFICSYTQSALASGAMLLTYGNGGAAQPNTTGQRSNKYSSGTTWPTTGSGTTGNGTTSQDQNDFCKCDVDTTHVYEIRRSGSTTADMQMYNGTSWSSKTAPPAVAGHKAGSGLFACPTADASAFYLFELDSTGNNLLQYCKYTVGSDTWGTWTTLEAAGSTARNYLSGCPVVGNNQIGVIWTAVNGSNFDIVVSALQLSTLTGDEGEAMPPASYAVLTGTSYPGAPLQYLDDEMLLPPPPRAGDDGGVIYRSITNW